jgi:hypothetical protein
VISFVASSSGLPLGLSCAEMKRRPSGPRSPLRVDVLAVLLKQLADVPLEGDVCLHVFGRAHWSIAGKGWCGSGPPR